MNYMNNNPIIIGIDHGYGNIKTAHCCFPTGVIISDKEPTFKSNLLVYNGSYYTVGEGHKEFISDKMTDGDYYILTLAAIARELNIRKQTSARVHLAAGLPLTWVSEQKDSFKAYLLQNEMADFIFRGVSYHVEFAGADIFPQGFSAVADRLRGIQGHQYALRHWQRNDECHVYQRAPSAISEVLHGEVRDKPVHDCCPGKSHAAVWRIGR